MKKLTFSLFAAVTLLTVSPVITAASELPPPTCYPCDDAPPALVLTIAATGTAAAELPPPTCYPCDDAPPAAL